MNVGNLCQVPYNQNPTEGRTMPTRNINLTHEQDEFVESVVRAGEYQNASEAIRDALRALKQRRQEDALKLERLRMRIEAGIDDLERGEFDEVDDPDLDAYFDGLNDSDEDRSR
jgi:antitoxin ParD1/3/4